MQEGGTSDVGVGEVYGIPKASELGIQLHGGEVSLKPLKIKKKALKFDICFTWLPVNMSATAAKVSGIPFQSLQIKPPAHPTYDLKEVIRVSLAEDSKDKDEANMLIEDSLPRDVDEERKPCPLAWRDS